MRFLLRLGSVLDITLVYLQRTIPIGVCEKTGDVAEVHDSEMSLTLFLTDTSATTYYLLELRHGVDTLVEGYEFHHLAIDTC